MEIIKEEIVQKYIIEKLTRKETSKFFGISETKLGKLLQKYGIKKPEKHLPSKEELVHLYIEENRRVSEIAEIFKCNTTTISSRLAKYNIVKPASLIVRLRKATSLKIYGTKSPAQNKEVQRKTKATNMVRYGTDNPAKNKNVQKKIEDTNIKRYGVKTTLLHKGTQEKIRKTTKERYGEYHFSKTKLYKEKYSKTCTERYGHASPFQNEQIKEQIQKIIIDKYGVDNVSKNEKIKQKKEKTCLKHFGKKTYLHSDAFKKDSFDKYGTELPVYSDIIKKRIIQNTFDKYGVISTSQLHISKESLKILNDKEKLKEFISSSFSKTCVAVANKLGVSDDTVARYVRLYRLEHLLISSVSTPEQEIKELLKEILLRKDRKILKGQEIDLYSEEHKIGIEFNGDYWHSDKFKDKNYHCNKSKLAQEKGVFLFHIFEYEWYNEHIKKLIIAKLNQLFKINQTIISADTCSIKEVTLKDKDIFLQNYCLQGSDNSSVCLGLYFNNELIFLMTFIKSNQEYWELSRYCCKNNYIVLNGANKVFNYFLRTYNPKLIFSFTNIAKENGDVQKSLGFIVNKILKPEYCLTNETITLTQEFCKLNNIKIDADLKYMKFKKVYDCGKVKWVWKC